MTNLCMLVLSSITVIMLKVILRILAATEAEPNGMPERKY